MGAKRPGWGTVNAVLNRLVAEGVIAAFRTSFSGPRPELDVHVIITPAESVTDAKADAIRSQVETALAEHMPATVTVDRSRGSSRPQVCTF
jgi:hypothetical protein